MRKATSATQSSSGQFLWAILIVLVALWMVAFAAHLSGGVITYLLMVSLAVLAIRSAAKRRKSASVGEDAVNDDRAA